MANIYFQRIKKFFGDVKLKAKKYQSLLVDIIDKNNEKVSVNVGRMTDRHYKESLSKLSKDKAELIDLPESRELIDRKTRVIKSKESGKKISRTLKKRLDNDLKQTLMEFSKSGKSKLEVINGKPTGKTNPELIEAFQKKITETYSSYTKRHPKTGVPPQVKNIAITEVRSRIDDMKERYAAELVKKNKNIKMETGWLHNRSLSKVPRLPHMNLSGTWVPFGTKFKVQKSDSIGFDLMSRPHDPNAPPDQVIGCNCDSIHRARIVS